MDFVNLHTHTCLGSMLDALSHVGELFEKVKEKGQKSLAITDHGTMAAHFDAYKASKKTGVKFIPGCEMYFVNSYELLENKKTEKRKHLVLLAQNHQGYKNLLKANFIGFKNQVRLMGRIFPRINWDVLKKYNEGIICTTACANGPISVLLNDDRFEEAERVLVKLQRIFEDRLYLELQPHHLKNEKIDQKKINHGLIELGQKYCVPLVAATDTHYITQEDEKYHDVLMAINSKAPVDDPKRHRYGIDDFFVKTGEEVFDFFNKHYGENVAKEAVENTVKIANLCEEPKYIFQEKNHLPIFDPKGEEDYNEFLKWKDNQTNKDLSEDKMFMRFKCIKGFKEKFSHMKREDKDIRWDRIKKEIKVIEGNDFSSYMLIVSDFIKWAKKNNITVGPGRGCTSKDTFVFAECGFRKIIDVKIGEKVFSHTGKLKEVENTFEYDVEGESCIKLKTDFSFGDLIFTKDHELFVEKSSVIKCGIESKVKRFRNIKNSPEWVRADEISCGDYIFFPWPKRERELVAQNIDLTKYMENNHYIDGENICKNISENNELSVEQLREDLNHNVTRTTKTIIFDEMFAYVIGRWIGNGWLCQTSSYGVGFTFNLEDTYGINIISQYFKNLGFSISLNTLKTKKLVQLCIYDKIIFNLFKEMFPLYKGNSGTKYIGEFKYLPENLLRQLIFGLKGYHESNKKKETGSLDSTSFRLIMDVREALLYLKIPSYISVRKKHSDVGHTYKESYKLRFTGFQKDNSRIISKRKFENGYFVSVKGIENVIVDKVYDIQVKDDHSYLTQNYASHNSAGGSLIANVLDIHKIDPIEYGLLFERFQNAYKKDLPDIDTDFSSSGRDKVKEYCKQKYGQECCAQISNIMTYSPKSIIPSLVKSMRNVIPNLIKEGENYVKVSEQIKAAIPEEYEDENGEKQKVKTLDKALSLSPDLVRFAEKCPELMGYAKKLVGLPSNFSTHAAALIIADQPIFNIAPLRIDKFGIVAVQYEKQRSESLGLIKMDLLSLSTLDIIDDTIKNILKLDPDSKIRCIDDIPLDDEKTFKMIQGGKTKCVFQLGKSTMMMNLSKSLKPKNITDIAIINALGRPSSSKEERQEFMDRRFGRKPIKYLHHSLEETLKDTYGLGIFEEQLLLIAQRVAGWDLNEADGLRKLTKLKGKDPELAEKLEINFIKGSMEKQNMTYEEALSIWEKIILPFAKYGFNKSHAIFYSINSYITAYLKCNFPAEFFAAYLKQNATDNSQSKEDDGLVAKSECKAMGVNIIPPDINKSGMNYDVIDKKTIVMGLKAIKGMGEKAVEEIFKKQPFYSFVDFLNKTENRVINKGKVEALSKAGCFDSLDLSRKFVFENGKKIRDKLSVFLKKKEKEGEPIEMALEQFPFIKDDEEWEKRKLLKYEQDVLGELVSGTIMDLYPGFFTQTTPLFSKLKMYPDREELIVEFVVKTMLREFKMKTGRNAGKYMIKYRVEDIVGTEIELTVWPTEYEFAKKIMLEGTPIRALCQISDFNGQRTLMLQKIEKVFKENNFC